MGASSLDRAMSKKRVGVLISGRGSNLGALVEACRVPSYPAKIVLVISNVPSAQGLLRAEAGLIPSRVIDHKDYASREEFDAALDAALGEAEVELLCNAGFMRLHTEGFVRRWWFDRTSLRSSVCLHSVDSRPGTRGNPSSGLCR